jgi:polyketide synthase 7
VNDDAKLLAYLKKVTGELAAARDEVTRLTQAAAEPVAVVSMACRFPGGVRTPEDLWELLAAGGDTVGPYPADRGWDGGLFEAAPDGSTQPPTGQGAFLHDAGDFDPEAFGISPREATAMDPQQRIILEVAWEAIERAGLPTSSLKGSATGVFVGATSFHYGGDFVNAPQDVAGRLLTGNVTSVISGRVSYTFGLTGPCLTLDTACSSALVCVHLAVQALRRGDCSAALAGGVCVMSRPGVFLEFAAQGGLAPDGRCRSFSADADGTGWGEGAGLVMLERLSDARRNGHPVLAVIRGSALNGDGASNGLSAPNGSAQRRVIEQALADARITPAGVDAVEAHGTGTRLGDPIEARALLEVYGAGRPADSPLWLGSMKSNIAHTQAASGVGGLIKVILSMAHSTLPATLHVTEPTPEAAWSRGGVRLLTEARPWPPRDTPRRAAVSAFGVSGTNAHVIVEEAPPPPPRDQAPDPAGAGAGHEAADGRPAPDAAGPWPFAVSARTPEALAAQAAELRAFVRRTDHDLAEIAAALVATRSRHEHRAVVIASDTAELDTRLAAVEAGGPDPGGDLVAVGQALDEPRPVLVFPGQGSQWRGMATELLDTSPVFAARLAECSDAVASVAGSGVIDVLRGGAEADLRRVDVVQPALWAVMVALAELWRAHGVTPSAVIGHSQGEIAAATVCGALSLADAARVCVLRSRALLAISGRGGMLSLAAGTGTVGGLIASRGGSASIAAVNGPGAVVVSGPVDDLAALSRDAEAAGIRTRFVDVDYASHSADVDELTARIESDLSGIRPRSGTVPLISTVSGDVIDTATLDARYWVTNLRRTVRLDTATRTALRRGHRLFIECSPHPVLGMALTATIEDVGVEAGVEASLRRGDGGYRRFLRSLAGAQVRGAEVSWAPVLAPPRRHVPLPTYAFQHRRFWYTPEPSTASSTTTTDGPAARTAEQTGTGQAPTRAASLRQTLSGLGAAAARAAVGDLVLAEVAAVLGYPTTAAVSARRPFKSLGVDSLTAVQLRNRLISATGLPLPVTLAFDHPHPEAVAAYVYEQLVPRPQDGARALVESLEIALGELAAAVDAEGPALSGDLRDARDDVLRRLRDLVGVCERIGADGACVTADLDTASDEEFFDLLDTELDARP